MNSHQFPAGWGSNYADIHAFQNSYATSGVARGGGGGGAKGAIAPPFFQGERALGVEQFVTS